MVLLMACWIIGLIYAIDINKGRLRILNETAKLHQVNSVINTIHADLRIFAVRYQIVEA